MPIFAAGSTHTAAVPVTVKPSGMPCTVQVFLAGPPDGSGNPTGTVIATGTGTFTSTGSPQTVNVPVTMPTGANSGVSAYAYVDVNITGLGLIAGMVDPANVLVPSGSGGTIVWT
jgi:hypothetical protein